MPSVDVLAELHTKSTEIPPSLADILQGENKKSQILTQISTPLMFGVASFGTGGLFRKYKNNSSMTDAGQPTGWGWVPRL